MAFQREIKMSLNSLRFVNLGYESEALATMVQIDVSEWLGKWPGAEITLLVKRSKTEAAYPAETVLQDGVLSWPIREYDASLPVDNGQAQISASKDGKKVISASFGYRVMKKMEEDGDAIPSGGAHPSWVDTVLEAARQVNDTAERAQALLDLVHSDTQEIIFDGGDAEGIP